MDVKIIKNSGIEVFFDIQKIKETLEEVKKSENINIENLITEINTNIKELANNVKRPLSINEVQEMVENILIKNKCYNMLKKYILYRYTRARETNNKLSTMEENILSLVDYKNSIINEENSNKNSHLNSTQRDYMAGEISKELAKKVLIDKDILEAHNEGIIHFHDLDYAIQKIHNCDLIDMETLLNDNLIISGVLIEKPKSFLTACNIVSQIIAQVASNQYGGQTFTLSHLVPFVEKSRQNIIKEVEELNLNITKEEKKRIIDTRLKKEIRQGLQTLQYQILTLLTTNGQTPFVSEFLYLGEVKTEKEKEDLAMLIAETFKQRILGVKNVKGVYVPASFPKLLYVLEEDNIYENSKYWYLTELASKCVATRMTPDFISEKIMLENKGDCYPCMGCRSFLTPYKENGKSKYYGRFNQGVVTINLVDVALSSKKDIKEFWKIFDERLNLCYRALMIKHNHLLGTLSDCSPILWQCGGLAKLKTGETIDKLLYNGYSTISLGYGGLYECVKYMTDCSHTEEKGKELALQIMKYLNDKCTEWKNKEHIDFSLYGTPMESTTYKFAKCLQKRFGIIKGITDKNYITNSYHINVQENINAFDKLKFEAEFQKLSPGGCISYVELPKMSDNLIAIQTLIKYIYNTIQYAEFNIKSDYCQKCGYNGEIEIVEENNKLIWKCPNCGNEDQNTMNVIRRTCGYIGTQYWNQGRTQEIKDRVLHL